MTNMSQLVRGPDCAAEIQCGPHKTYVNEHHSIHAQTTSRRSNEEAQSMGSLVNDGVNLVLRTKIRSQNAKVTDGFDPVSFVPDSI